MRRSSILAACLALGSCTLDAAGKPCEADEDCGPGFDCFPDVCVRVCTKDDECAQGESCFRYHCTVPGQEHAPRARAVKKSEPPAAREVPPVPDATAAELRAIRRELELLRRDVQQLLANQPAAQPPQAHAHEPPGKPPKQLQLPPKPPPPPPK